MRDAPPGAMAGQATAARESQVQSAISDLANIVSVLEETAEGLVHRLCQMLTPCGPSDISNLANKSTPTPVVAPHAENLHSQVSRLRNLNAKLQDLHNRYEG